MEGEKFGKLKTSMTKGAILCMFRQNIGSAMLIRLRDHLVQHSVHTVANQLSTRDQQSRTWCNSTLPPMFPSNWRT